MKQQDRLYPSQRIFHAFVAAIGPNIMPFVLDTIALVNGNGIIITADIFASDVAVPADASSTHYVQGFRVAAGALVAITANSTSKQVSGGAGTFSQDVTFTVAPSVTTPGNLELVATNGGGGGRTGNVSVLWYSNKGQFT